MCTFYFYNNSGKYEKNNSSFIVAFSVEPQKRWTKICHLTLNVKSVATVTCKIECSTVQHYNTLLNADVMQNRILTVTV